MSLKGGTQGVGGAHPDITTAQAERAQAAAELVRAMMPTVDRFSESDATLSQAELLSMSINEHWAWSIRFLPDSANLATLARIYVQHGRSVPNFLAQDCDFEGRA